MSIPKAHDITYEIEQSYCFYKCSNAVFSLFPMIFSVILCYGIYKICIDENIYKYGDILFGCIAFLIITIVATYKFNKLRELKCKDEIYDIIIAYLKTAYIYKGYAQIEKFSFFEIMDILSVYKKCLKLHILDEDQLNNLDIIIKDLKSQSDL